MGKEMELDMPFGLRQFNIFWVHPASRETNLYKVMGKRPADWHHLVLKNK